MRDFKYGVVADMAILGGMELPSDVNLSGQSHAIEFHLWPINYGTRVGTLNSRLDLTRSWRVGSGSVVGISGFAGETYEAAVPAFNESRPLRVRFEVDTVTGGRTIIVNNGAGQGDTVIDITSDYTGVMPSEINELNAGNGEYLLALMVCQLDSGSGWQDVHVFDPGQVSDGAGRFVQRDGASAEAGSERKLYDVLGGLAYESSASDVTGAFPAVYDVIDVNGGAIELGQSFTVEMSNAITIDDLYFKAQDGTGNEYHPTFSVSGRVISGSVPLTSDDTLTMLGTMTMHVVSGPDTFTKDFEFTAPAGDAVVLLEDPIELDESSYSYGMTWNPIAGDYYFHNPASDFSITVNNVLQPSGTAPWEHTVWHLSGEGLRETTVQSGYAVQNLSPTADAGTDLIDIAPGASIPLDGSGSTDDDGTIVSYLWEQVGASNAPINDPSAATTTATAPRSSNASTLTFRLTVTDDLGATATDTKTVSVLADQKPTFVGDTSPITVEYGSVFTPPSLTVVDAEDGDLGAATVTGTVDTGTLGNYTLTVTGPQDSNGVAPDSVTFDVFVVDTIAPTITPDTAGDITIAMGDVWPNPTATVTDNYDPTRTIYSDTTTLDTSAPGSGQITFTATDSSGNVATPVTQSYSIFADYTDIVELVAQVSEWNVSKDGEIRAFLGRSNREVFKFKPSDPEGLMVDADGYLDLSAPYVDKIEVHLNQDIIDTTTSSVIIKDKSELCARLGDFQGTGNGAKGNISVVIYVGGDTRGTVIASPSLSRGAIMAEVSEV